MKKELWEYVVALPRPANRRPPGNAVTRLSLFGRVTAASTADLSRAIWAARQDTILLEIDSEGGSGICGAAILEELLRHPRRVITHVVDKGNSAASLVAMGGDRRRISPHATMLMHKSKGECEAACRRMDEVSIEVFAAATGRERCVVDAWESAGLTFTAAEAVEVGLAHEICDPGARRMYPAPVASGAATTSRRSRHLT
jgi:ATP-dependent protease ClpP protease subunit